MPPTDAEVLACTPAPATNLRKRTGATVAPRPAAPCARPARDIYCAPHAKPRPHRTHPEPPP